MGYKIDCEAGVCEGYSCKLFVADRAFYIKLFSNPSVQSTVFSCNQDGAVEKEISKTEFDLWLNVLADTKQEVAEIKQKLASVKKY